MNGMENLRIRKVQLTLERVHHAGGPVLDEPLRRGSIAAVLANPFAGRHEPDLSGFMESLIPLGMSMAEELRDALTAHGFAARAERTGGNQLRIVSEHCPFGSAPIEHPVICAVDRGLVRGMLGALYGEAETDLSASLPMGDSVCITEVTV